MAITFPYVFEGTTVWLPLTLSALNHWWAPIDATVVSSISSTILAGVLSALSKYLHSIDLRNLSIPNFEYFTHKNGKKTLRYGTEYNVLGLSSWFFSETTSVFQSPRGLCTTTGYSIAGVAMDFQCTIPHLGCGSIRKEAQKA